MSRRVVLIIALGALAVLGTAAVPWTLSSGNLSAAVARYLQTTYDITFKANGRSTIAFLPVPRLKFENVTLAGADGRFSTEGGTLRAELKILPLVTGRLEFSEVGLDGIQFTASLQKIRALDWADLLKPRKGTASPSMPRVILTSASVHWTDLPQGNLEKVNAVINWPGTDEALECAGSVVWRGETIQITRWSITPAILAAERPSPFALSVVAPSGSVTLSGEAQIGEDPRITGQGTIQALSVRDFSRWSDLGLPLSPLIQALSITGDFSVTKRRISWPSVSVALGEDKLEGTLSVRLDSDRPVIAGTLAADSLDLSDFFEPFAQARTLSGAWSEDGLNLARSTSGDLDLRISANSAQLGLVRLGDMAASILVKPGQIEASLGRASFHEGSLKGRLSLARVEGGTEVKSQATFDQVDIASFLSLVGQPRWITGRAQGQIQIEGTGKTTAELVRQSRGRTAITVRRGELIGIGLNDLMKRIEKRPLATSLDWRGGRTAFDVAQVNLNIGSGIGQITEGRLSAPDLQTTLQGQISLVDRTLDLKALVDPATPSAVISPLIMFDVGGGWDAVRVTPDVKSLIQRSGAAKPLFGSDHAGQNPALPIATAQ